MMKEEHWNRGITRDVRESKWRRDKRQCSCTQRKTNAARKTEQIPDSLTGETQQRHCTFLSKWTEEFTWLVQKGETAMHAVFDMSCWKEDYVFTEGCTNLQRSALTRHVATVDHKDAISIVQLQIESFIFRRIQDFLDF